MHYVTPNYDPGTQGCGWMCECSGPSVTRHETPLLFNIKKDPSEASPLDTSLPHHKEVMDKMAAAVAAHTAKLDPPTSQFRFFSTFWVPWLQPYCNFPHFTCKDPKYSKDS